ncbi:unnamed protein product [Nyctereutes procyonoides]|uniref:(raccoon dog) hypothetical protein n=1 Tax=Nyctereutes procyonoides TaxID=34880 RepID=A0A811Z078_NYCPR|nr:unnamed protein product [Nyctereutes procyonoides]
MHGTTSHEHPWKVAHESYLFRDPAEIVKEEQAAAEKAVAKEEFQGQCTAPAPEFTGAQPEAADWSEGGQVCSAPSQRPLLGPGAPSWPPKTGLLVVARGWGWGQGEVDGSGQKVQTSHCKIN